MSVLIIAISFSLLFAFLATQNTQGVTLQAGGFLFSGVPVYMVVLGSLLIGIVLSWVLSLFGWAASAMTISGKDRTLREKDKTVTQLERRIQDLEKENARLTNKPLPKGDDDTTHRPGVVDRFRQNLS